jgi:signal transduction histidine kinase
MSEVAEPQNLRRLLDAVLTVGSDLDLPSMLLRIVEAAVDLVDARFGALGVLDESHSRLAQFITVGIDDAGRRAIGDLPEGHGLLGSLIVDARPLRQTDIAKHPDSYGFPPHHPPMTSFLGVPLRLRDDVFGNLYLTDKTTAPAFTDVDEELVVGLASAAGVAIENARLHTKLYELGMTADRERIARELHDTVIQRLFATGLSLQATARMLEADPDGAAARIDAAVDDLDETVKQIRTAIFDLDVSRPTGYGLRDELMVLAREAAGPLGFDPHVLLDGPIDTAVPERVRAHAVAVLREGLTNVTRHAQAARVDVRVEATADQLTVRIADDGVGPPSGSTTGHGLSNMAHRAADLGGSFRFEPGDGGGSVVTWTVPLT